MKAVANSSVLIALSNIGRLELIPQRFPEGISIPQAVWREVIEAGASRPGVAELKSAAWLTVHPVQDHGLVTLLRTELDEGEAEAIALGREQQAGVLLLDEKDARQAAMRLKFPVLGTVGLLIWAKRKGLIAKLSEELDILQTQGRFHLSRSVYEEALRAVGEES